MYRIGCLLVMREDNITTGIYKILKAGAGVSCLPVGEPRPQSTHDDTPEFQASLPIAFSLSWDGYSAGVHISIEIPI